MSRHSMILIGLCALFALPAPGVAQEMPDGPQVVRLSGPRLGITALVGDALVQRARNHGIRPVFTQFGWQFERRFYAGEGGFSALNELVLLAGGLEQGTLIPSATWLVGLRGAGGTEAGVGPNVSPAGLALAVAGGVTVRSGFLQFPLSVAAVPSESGVRVSVLSGFAMVR